MRKNMILIVKNYYFNILIITVISHLKVLINVLDGLMLINQNHLILKQSTNNNNNNNLYWNNIKLI